MFQFRFHQEEQECLEEPVKQDFLASRCITPHPQAIPVIAECLPVSNEWVLFKRTVSDAKFHVALNDEEPLEKHHSATHSLSTAIVQNTDLIAGVYEGGMKTWECSIDLARYLYHHRLEYKGKTVLELGCGSALPGIVCLMHGAQNEEVIHLITVPNVLLNTLHSLNHPLHPLYTTEKPNQEQELTEGQFETLIQPSLLAQLPVRFYSGDWATLADVLPDEYDMILTSETLYCAESIPRLVKIIEKKLKKDGVCFIATKTNYFGCTGSLQHLKEYIESNSSCQLKLETVQVFNDSVRREIVQLSKK